MQTREIPGFTVGAIGLGCMPMSHLYNPGERDDASSIEVLRAAPPLGMTLLDTAPIYGAGHNESLVGQAMHNRRENFELASKCGLYATEDGGRVNNGQPEHIIKECDESLRRLQTDVIDVFQLHRVDPEVPVEESWGAMVELKRAGKVRSLGISEATLEQIQTAHAIEPVAVVQSELSLWTRAWADDVLPWTTANNVTFLAFSPVGRGFLTGTMAADHVFAKGDYRATNPRFSPEALVANQALLEVIRPIAAAHEATLAQIALAWLLQLAPNIIPIPGTRDMQHLHEDAAADSIVLTDDEMETLTNLPPATGTRY